MMQRRAIPNRHMAYQDLLPKRHSFQGKTPWVDSACADCPGFWVLGAGPAQASTCAPGLAFGLMGPWTFARICCPQLSRHWCKNGMHSTSFYIIGGHAPVIQPRQNPHLVKGNVTHAHVFLRRLETQRDKATGKNNKKLGLVF